MRLHNNSAKVYPIVITSYFEIAQFIIKKAHMPDLLDFFGFVHGSFPQVIHKIVDKLRNSLKSLGNLPNKHRYKPGIRQRRPEFLTKFGNDV